MMRAHDNKYLVVLLSNQSAADSAVYNKDGFPNELVHYH